MDVKQLRNLILGACHPRNGCIRISLRNSVYVHERARARVLARLHAAPAEESIRLHRKYCGFL